MPATVARALLVSTAAPGSTTWTAGGGPQWGSGVAVDVVAQIRGPDGTVRLVRAADQLILGTF